MLNIFSEINRRVVFLKEEKDLVAASSQSVSARVGAWRRGRRGQGDRGGRVHRLVHGQDQTGAPDGHVLLPRGQIVVQSLVQQAAPSASTGGAVPADGARAAGVRTDGHVREHGAHAGVVQDEVGVVVVELTFVLRREDGEGKKKTHQKSKWLIDDYRQDGCWWLTSSFSLISPNLIGLRAGETPGQRSTAGRQRSGEGGSAVGQEGLQVAEGSLLSRRDHILCKQMHHTRKGMQKPLKMLEIIFKWGDTAPWW